MKIHDFFIIIRNITQRFNNMVTLGLYINQIHDIQEINDTHSSWKFNSVGKGDNGLYKSISIALMI